jgi:hypothetical protein
MAVGKRKNRTRELVLSFPNDARGWREGDFRIIGKEANGG